MKMSEWRPRAARADDARRGPVGGTARRRRERRRRRYEHIYAKFETSDDIVGLYDVPPSERATGWPFSSMMRIKLIWDLIHAKRRNGGCELDVDELVYNGDLLAFLGLHDGQERRELYDAFCYMSAPPARGTRLRGRGTRRRREVRGAAAASVRAPATYDVAGRRCGCRRACRSTGT